MKFQSCLTLLAQAAKENRVFQQALHRYFGGALDQRTMQLLAAEQAVNRQA